MMILMFVASMVIMILTDKHIVSEDADTRVINVVWHNIKKLEYDNLRFEWDDISFNRQGVYCAVYKQDGTLLKGAFPAHFDDTGLNFENARVRTVSQNGHQFYVYDVEWDMDIQVLWIRGMVDTGVDYDSMNTIMTLTFTILPAILLIGIVGGWFISKKTFAPIEELTEKVSSISGSSDLSARVDSTSHTLEMKKLADTFDDMFERLEESFESEKQFVSDASHELRTPTTVILAECSRAKRKAETKEEFDKSISVIQEQGEKMSNMITQLLSITRLEQGTEKTRMKEVNLSQLTESCCEEFVPKNDKGIKLTTNIDDDIMVEIDMGLMSRVIQNLLENAYKYGKENGHIKVSLRNSRSMAVLTVADDGIGIASENMENIWKRFWQADESRGVDEGVGLGLAMVKQMVEYMNGSIEAESTLGEGTKFIVKFLIK